MLISWRTLKHIVLIVLIINRTRFAERTQQLEENWVTSILMNASLTEDLVLSGLTSDVRNKFPVAAMETNGRPGEALYPEELISSCVQQRNSGAQGLAQLGRYSSWT